MSTFRITTNGMFRNYRSNLSKNNKRLNDTMTNVQTQRKFNTYAEDPAAASKAWRLRRSYWNTGNQIDNNTYVISKFESAYSAMGAIVDGDTEHPGLDGLLATIEGVSDSSGAARTALGRDLLSTAESIVSMMNTKYGDDFIFAGADGANIPFAWGKDANGNDALFYRGVNVGLGEPEKLDSSQFGLTDEVLEKYNLTSPALESYDKIKDKDKVDVEKLRMEQPLTKEEFLKNSEVYAQYESVADNEDDKYAEYQKEYVKALESTTPHVTLGSGEASYASKFNDAQQLYRKVSKFQDYVKDYCLKNGVKTYAEGVEGYQKLQDMANEETYVDIGLGMQEDDNGKFIKGSAFNSAVSGLNFLGYGEDKNLAMLVRELGTIFHNADPETGAYSKDDAEAEKLANRASELLDKIHDAVRSAQGQHVQLSADSKYLKTNLKQLETVKSELNEQIMDTESMDPAEAITEMTWAQYCYNAALRIGTNILSQSLIDYMQ